MRKGQDMDDTRFIRNMIDSEADEMEDILALYDQAHDTDGELDRALTWILCNARHWADRSGHTWSELLRRGNSLYQSEIEECDEEIAREA
jgi:hypothetical protein